MNTKLTTRIELRYFYEKDGIIRYNFFNIIILIYQSEEIAAGFYKNRSKS